MAHWRCGGGAPINSTKLSASQVMTVISGGRNNMPGFAAFSPQDLLDVSSYVKERLK